MDRSNEKRLCWIFCPVLVLSVALVVSLLATTAIWAQVTWQVDDAIVVNLAVPSPNSVWLGDTPHILTCGADGTDEWQEDANSPWNVVADSFTFNWSGSGTFPDNITMGGEVNYISPWINGTDTITVTATDTNPAVPGNTKPLVTAVQVVLPVVTIVGFDGSYQLFQTPTGDGVSVWDDSTTAIPSDAIYNAADPPGVQSAKNHMCTQMGSTVTALATCQVSVALTEAADLALSATGTNNWDFGNCTIAANSTVSGVSSCPQLDTMKPYVRAAVQSLGWQCKVPAGANVTRTINTTNHKIYLTYGEPAGSVVTVQRILSITSAANGLPTELPPIDRTQCADAVFQSLNASYTPGAPNWGPKPIWLINDGDPSQCPGLAVFVRENFQMLGLGKGDLRFCYATIDGDYAEAGGPVPFQTRPVVVGAGAHAADTTHDDFSATERLAMIDAAGVPNRYEATCLFNGWYYGLVGHGVAIFESPADVVSSLFTPQWQYATSVKAAGPPVKYNWANCDVDPWVDETEDDDEDD